MCNDYMVYKEDYKSYQIRIEFDFDAQNPRTEFDELGKVVLFGRYHYLSDKDLKGYAFKDRDGWEEWIKDEKPQFAVCLPVDVCDGGSNGTTIRIGYQVDNADGFAFITREDALKEYSAKILTKSVKERAEKLLRGEIETYNDYLQGNVYGWVVEKDGEHLDSVWGYYGDYDSEYGCMYDAKHYIDYLVTKADEQAQDAADWKE